MKTLLDEGVLEVISNSSGYFIIGYIIIT